jgi:hypothetical protein
MLIRKSVNFMCGIDTRNENKMSDGGRNRTSLGVNMWKSSQKWSAQRSAVRSIAWLDGWRGYIIDVLEQYSICDRITSQGKTTTTSQGQ